MVLGAYIYRLQWDCIKRTQDVLAKGVLDVAKGKVDAMMDRDRSTLKRLDTLASEVVKSQSVTPAAVEQFKSIVDELARVPYYNREQIKGLELIAAELEKCSAASASAPSALEGTPPSPPI